MRTVSLGPQHGFKGRQQEKHVLLAAGVPHQADAPDLAGELAQPAADFNAVMVEQRLAYGEVRAVMRMVARCGIEMLNVVAHVSEDE